MSSIEDRLLVERLLNMYLVPFTLSSEERMKKLFILFSTIDENACKAFIEIQKHQLHVRKVCINTYEARINKFNRVPQTPLFMRQPELATETREACLCDGESPKELFLDPI